MKVWRWVDEYFGTPVTIEDWAWFLVIYVAIPMFTIMLVVI